MRALCERLGSCRHVQAGICRDAKVFRVELSLACEEAAEVRIDLRMVTDRQGVERDPSS